MLESTLAKREIGGSGLFASVLGLGCNSLGWRADEPTSRSIVHAALDAGITFFDTADIYGRHGGSERILGAALGARRPDVLIATKFGAPMSRGAPPMEASRAYIFSAVEASLRRLGTDWIDLYQMHWPDPGTPIAETLGALDELRRQGKIRAAGCCNLTAAQFLEARRCAKKTGLASFISVQAAYSLIEREIEDELLPALSAEKVSLIPYFPLAGGLLNFPLAGGLLTEKYAEPSANPRGRLDAFEPHRQRFLTEDRMRVAQDRRAEAGREGKSLLAYSLQWLSRQPTVATIIAGASRPEQVLANAAALR